LIEDLDVDKTIGLYWNVITLVRWSTLCLILVCLGNYPGLQIISLSVQAILMQALIVVGKPMTSHIENKMALFNEAAVSVYLYISISLTGYQGPNVR
jgi:hypothetical protein